MLTSEDYVIQSIDLNLFFTRIMKEHATFLEVGLSDNDEIFRKKAKFLKDQFLELLYETIIMSEGIVSLDVKKSGELITNQTEKAENRTQFLTGVEIDTRVTNMETDLISYRPIQIPNCTVKNVRNLNDVAIQASDQLLQLKKTILDQVTNCGMMTSMYPMEIEHIIKEGELYRSMLINLQSGDEISDLEEAFVTEQFWDDIMAEHSKFIRGLLDPTEEQLIAIADYFAHRFDILKNEVKIQPEDKDNLQQITQNNLDETILLRDFKEQGTIGSLQCNIKSITSPLFFDHVVREANYYIRVLKRIARSKNM